MTLPELLDWLGKNGAQLVVPVGAVVLVVMFVLVIRAIRKGKADSVVVAFAAVTALGFSAEGMFEVTEETLKLPLYMGLLLFSVGEAAMIAFGIRAHRHFERTSKTTAGASLGKNGRFVWVVAILTGFVVSLNATSAVEYFVRLLMPLLAAALWWMGYADDTVKQQGVSWVWTPRRIGVALGLIQPGDQDLTEVHRERQIRAMTNVGFRVHSGPVKRRQRHTAKLARLALAADDDMVSEAQRRISRAHQIVARTAPGPATPATPTQVMDVPAPRLNGQPVAAALPDVAWFRTPTAEQEIVR